MDTLKVQTRQETGEEQDQKGPSNVFKSNLQIEDFLQKNSQKIEQFLTRAEKINRTVFPPNREGVVIVKAKKEVYKLV